jgi:hypothetical protein
MKIDPNLVTLASYPRGEWVYFTDDDGSPSTNGFDLALARLNGYVESVVGPQGLSGPLYHRITDKGVAFLARERTGTPPLKRML